MEKTINKTTHPVKNEYAQLSKADKKYLWHPFTQMQEFLKEDPLIIAEGKGNYLIDIEGGKYLDGISSLWVTVHGHHHPDLNAAIIAQVEKISHSTLLGISNVPAIELAQQLVKISPRGLSKVFYSECGAAAVEIGLKIAFQYWQQRKHPRPKKTKFLFLQNSYHGDTLGAVGVGGIDLFHKIYRPLLTEHIRVSAPYCYRCFLGKNRTSCKMDCGDELERVIRSHHKEIGAFIIEPLVQGAAGMIMAPRGYLKKAKKLCDKYEILLIADEVAVGFGRTGKMFACEHEKVSPDIMVVGKGITGGYLPLAATLTTDKIYKAFLGELHEFKTFFHGHTYTGNPVSCAAALANLSVFKKEKTLEKLQDKISLLTELLKKFKPLEHVGEIRQKGFMVGIELVLDKKTKAPYAVKEKIGIRVIKEARKNGLIIRPLGDIIVLMPPLSIAGAELKKIADITFAAIKKVTEK
jgi:adenosylmethionine-8-amino-7-oxononanoate aminotransferase